MLARMLSRSARATLFFAALATPGRAQTVPESTSDRAETLFREGVLKFEQGDFATACASFVESQRIDPKLGTLLNLALCHERQGRTATAWAEFTNAAAWSTSNGQKDRRNFANDHVIALEGQLAYVELRLPNQPNLKVTIDGESLAPWHRSPLFVDPGTHSIAVSAEGMKPYTTTITVPTGPITKTAEIPPLVAVVTPPPPRRAPPPPRPRFAQPRAIAGAITAGAGLAAIGFGTYFGLRTFALKGDVEANCTAGMCDPPGLELEREVHAAATGSTIAFSLGAAALAAGAYLLFSSPRAPAAAWVLPIAGPRTAGLGTIAAW